MKVVAYCGTRNVYNDMVIACKSLLTHTKVDKVYFIIEDDIFPQPLPDIIECINVTNQTYFNKDGPNYKNRWSYMVLMRAALSKILPSEVDKVLSLDIDTIVNEDISELWDIDLDNYYLAGVREPFKTTSYFLYVNFGVALLNLKLLRKNKKDDRIIQILNTTEYKANEQDAFNYNCQGKIYLLPGNYNASNFTSKVFGVEKITHYAGIHSNMWHKYEKVKKYETMDWEEVMKCQI